MCPNEIVHSGRQHQGSTLGKRLYCDSYLTYRPARCAGATASFNFTKLHGQSKSAPGCLCEDKEVSERTRARGVEGKVNGAVVWPNTTLKKQPVFLALARRDVSYNGCSHFLIPLEYILHLTSKPYEAAAKLPTFFLAERGRVERGVSVTQEQQPHCDCQGLQASASVA